MDKIKLAESLFAKMQEHKPIWEHLQRRIMPRALSAANNDEQQIIPRKGTYSSVANLGLNTLASAHLNYITPIDQRWFSLKSKLTGKETTAKAKDWFAKATEQTYAALAGSNFYTSIHEVYLDRCLTGTGCMFIEMTDDGHLTFRHIPTGTYAIAEGVDKTVDTLVRKIRLTPHQAAQNFGLKNLPDNIQAQYNDETKKYTENSEYYHIVTPNKAYSFGNIQTHYKQRKWSDTYIHLASKKVVQENGYYEFPFLVTRYLTFGANPYGNSPGFNAIPEIESSLFLERVLDTLGEVAAFPRILELANQVGEVDLRAGGRTIISPEAASMNLPREWATAGKYDVGIDRLKDKEEKIKQAFHVQMLQVISSVDRQMTATEVNARESEKVLAFSPSFTLFISDFRPCMQRIFALLYRSGIYDRENTPEEIITHSADKTQKEINIPQIRYMGKIAQAVERQARNGMEGALATISNFTQVTQDPTMTKALKQWEILRFIWDSSGAPTDCMMNQEEFDQMKQAEAQQAEAQMQMQAMESIQKIQPTQ